MSQESFIYSFVARGTMILAEYTEFTGNFPAIAAQCLQKLPTSNNKFTYNCDHHTFNFLVEDGYVREVELHAGVAGSNVKQRNVRIYDLFYLVCSGKLETSELFELGFAWFSEILKTWHLAQLTRLGNQDATQNLTDCPLFWTPHFMRIAYCVVAKDSVGKQISIAFLERVRADFKKRYGGGKADTAIAKSLNKEFGPIMKEHMKYIIDHAEEIEKLLKVKAQVSEVKSIMLENIDKAIDRGENLTVLVDKTEDLRSQAQDYKNKGTQMRRKMWYQNMKIKLVVFGILLLLILVIWLSICHGFDCTN
ncbi:hypothetical protein C1H46_024485 [Malus baccata]|uniref:V-SNARE coiled-coil homology domain-containing protein n=1 Tax=Malus baccata TaxID=106549 RepID=A0A540LTU9_MALBA|nr:hypothetical protein C1H46_024485 [Malus baccata]